MLVSAPLRCKLPLASLTNGGAIPDMFEYQVVLDPENVVVGRLIPAGTGFAANQRASVSSEEIQDIEEALKKELLESFQ